MRKKDRIAKKQAKRRLKTVERVFRRMNRQSFIGAVSAVTSDFIYTKLKQSSLAAAIIAPMRTLESPMAAAIVDGTGIVHWTALVSKASVPRPSWPRVTLCDANQDRSQASCSMTSAQPTCVECLAREGG